jgi:HEAT repeats
MIKPSKLHLHLISGLKLLLIAGLLFLLNISLLDISPVLAQTIPRNQIPTLIEQLTDADFQVRHEANDALVNMGSTAVPALCKALKSENRQLRWRAVAAIASIGSDATAAVPNLTRNEGSSKSECEGEQASAFLYTIALGDARILYYFTC